MFGIFDRYVRKLRGHNRVRSVGAAQRVGDWYIETETSWIVVEVSVIENRIEIDVEKLEPLAWRSRAVWIAVHVATFMGTLAVCEWIYG